MLLPEPTVRCSMKMPLKDTDTQFPKIQFCIDLYIQTLRTDVVIQFTPITPYLLFHFNSIQLLIQFKLVHTVI